MTKASGKTIPALRTIDIKPTECTGWRSEGEFPIMSHVRAARNVSILTWADG